MPWTSTLEEDLPDKNKTRIATLEQTVANLEPGSGGGGTVYETFFEEVTRTSGFRGVALPNTDPTSNTFEISFIVIDLDTLEVTRTYPNGDASFSYAWSDRHTYTYSGI